MSLDNSLLSTASIAAPMSFQQFPVELLLGIASHLPRARDLNALVCVSRGLYQALDKRLYDTKANAEVFAEIKEGRDVTVKRLLKEFPALAMSPATVPYHPYYPTPVRLTPLWHAATYNYTNIALILLDYGADFHLSDLANKCESPFHIAVRNNRFHLAATLLSRGANVQKPYPNWGVRCLDCTPLQMACILAAADMVELLLINGADIDSRNDILQTALHWAVHSGETGYDLYCDPPHNKQGLDSIKTVELLLRSGANVELEDLYGRTPIDLTWWSPNGVAIRRILREHKKKGSSAGNEPLPIQMAKDDMNGGLPKTIPDH